VLRVALVEDDDSTRSQLRSFLTRYAEEHGLELQVSLFSDGAEIPEHYRPAYDIIFLDIEMPRLNGMETAERILAELGPCDILVNGAGGNNPKATTDKEYYFAGDMDADTKSFFDLDQAGVSSVFDLNFIGTLLPTQVFAAQMVERGGNIINISSMNAYTPLTKIPAYSGAKAAISNFTQWLAVHFSKSGIRVNAIAPGFFSTKQNAKLLWNETAPPLPAPRRSLPPLPWTASARLRSWMVPCCSLSTIRPPASSPVWSCLWMAASPPIPVYNQRRI